MDCTFKAVMETSFHNKVGGIAYTFSRKSAFDECFAGVLVTQEVFSSLMNLLVAVEPEGPVDQEPVNFALAKAPVK
jgi:hypothetical protein